MIASCKLRFSHNLSFPPNLQKVNRATESSWLISKNCNSTTRWAQWMHSRSFRTMFSSSSPSSDTHFAATFDHQKNLKHVEVDTKAMRSLDLSKAKLNSIAGHFYSIWDKTSWSLCRPQLLDSKATLISWVESGRPWRVWNYVLKLHYLKTLLSFF